MAAEDYKGLLGEEEKVSNVNGGSKDLRLNQKARTALEGRGSPMNDDQELQSGLEDRDVKSILIINENNKVTEEIVSQRNHNEIMQEQLSQAL